MGNTAGRISSVLPVPVMCLAVLLAWPSGGASAPSYSGTITGTFTNPILVGFVFDVVDNRFEFENNSSTAVHTGFGTSSIT